MTNDFLIRAALIIKLTPVIVLFLLQNNRESLDLIYDTFPRLGDRKSSKRKDVKMSNKNFVT